MAPGALLGEAPVNLAGWYAAPMTRSAAADLLTRSQSVIQQRLREGSDWYQLHLLVMLCLFWQGADVKTGYCEAIRCFPGQHARALLELVTGQLLVSRKLSGAGAFLARGLQLATDLLPNRDYFMLLRRHEMLARLPLSNTPSPAQNLPELLVEAAVISRLQAEHTRPSGSCLDTVG